MELPDLDAAYDARRTRAGRRTVLSGDDPRPARVDANHLAPDSARDDLDAILGLAAKYDRVFVDPRAPRIHRPSDVLAEHATATFWPRDPIRAPVAGAAASGSRSSAGTSASRS